MSIPAWKWHSLREEPPAEQKEWWGETLSRGDGCGNFQSVPQAVSTTALVSFKIITEAIIEFNTTLQMFG